jgi:hypothetical protein
VTSRLHERYTAEVVPALQKQFEYGTRTRSRASRRSSSTSVSARR